MEEISRVSSDMVQITVGRILFYMIRILRIYFFKGMLENYSKFNEEEDLEQHAEKYVGKRFAKIFLDDNTGKSALFFGTVQSYDAKNKFWHVVYDDNDHDENDKKDMQVGMKLYHEKKSLDLKARMN
jgi:hypothetical protein